RRYFGHLNQDTPQHLRRANNLFEHGSVVDLFFQGEVFPVELILQLLDFFEGSLQFGPRLVLLSDVHVGANEFHDLATRIEERMTEAMDVLDGAIRDYYTEIDLGPRFLADSSLPSLIEPLQVLGVNATSGFAVRDRAFGRIESEYPVCFARPIK